MSRGSTAVGQRLQGLGTGRTLDVKLLGRATARPAEILVATLAGELRLPTVHETAPRATWRRVHAALENGLHDNAALRSFADDVESVRSFQGHPRGDEGSGVHYRQLGRTGLQVSGIGYGAWGIGGAGSGWVGARDDESLRALELFIKLGGKFIDTARLGYGHGEELVGRVASAHDGEGLIVATKVLSRNQEWPARTGVPVEETFPGDHIRASVDASVRATGALDTVQVIYNVFHQQPEEQLLHACQEHGVRVIVWVALDVATDDAPDLALRYVLAQPAVSTVIAGCGPSGMWSATPRPATVGHCRRRAGGAQAAPVGAELVRRSLTRSTGTS